MTYLGVFVGFLTTFFVLTRFLTAEEIGLARVLIDTATLLMSLAQLGTSSSIIRFFPYFKTGTQQTSSYNGFFFWTVIVPLFGFALFGLLYWGFAPQLQGLFSEKSPLFVQYYYLVLPMAFFMLYQTVFETNANVLMRIVIPRMTRELFLRLFVLVAYLLYAFHVVTLNGMVWLLCGSYGLAALCNIIYLFAYGHISLRPDFSFIDKELARKYLYYTLFLIVSAIATAVMPVVSSFFISAQQGLAQTGIFAIATYIATMVSIPNRSLGAIANPQLAQCTKDADVSGMNQLLRQISNNSLLVGLLILTLIWLNIDLIFLILPNGGTYATARYVVLLLGLAHLLMATMSGVASVLSFSRYYYLSLFLSLLLTALSLVLNNALIPILGINGAALATLLAYLIYYALLLITVSLCCHVHPFSAPQLKSLTLMLLLVAAGAGIDYLLPASTINTWIGSCVKSLLWCSAAFIAYRRHYSPEISALVDGFFKQTKQN